MQKALLLLLCSLVVFVPACSQEQFEGELNYRNFENHNNAARKLSDGISYNGARNVKILIKGNKMHIIDESLHMHTLLLPDEDYAIIYSDLLKRGIRGTYRSYAMTFPNKKDSSSFSLIERNEIVKKLDVKKNIIGYDCIGYKTTIKAGEKGKESNFAGENEIWLTTKYALPTEYYYYLNNIDINGIVLKSTTRSTGKVPFIGNISSFVASEIKSIIPRYVEDSLMQVPVGYEWTDTDSLSKMVELYKDTKKYLKKHKMYPGDADADSEVIYKIEDEWDY